MFRVCVCVACVRATRREISVVSRHVFVAAAAPAPAAPRVPSLQKEAIISRVLEISIVNSIMAKICNGKNKGLAILSLFRLCLYHQYY